MYYCEPKMFDLLQRRTEEFLALPEYLGDKHLESVVRKIAALDYVTPIWSCESHPKNDGSRPIKRDDYTEMHVIVALKPCPEAEQFLETFIRSWEFRVCIQMLESVVDLEGDYVNVSIFAEIPTEPAKREKLRLLEELIDGIVS